MIELHSDAAVIWDSEKYTDGHIANGIFFAQRNIRFDTVIS